MSAPHPVLPCEDCGHPTRSTHTRIADAPGTRQRIGAKCTHCVPEYTQVTPERLRYVRGEVEAFEAARRKRLAARQLVGARA